MQKKKVYIPVREHPEINFIGNIYVYAPQIYDSN